jgi:hypothetical protein
MSEWKLTKEADVTQCENCKKFCPPIYEVTYKRSPGAATMYHYFCHWCATDVAGGEIVLAGLRSSKNREDARRECLRSNIARDPDKRPAEVRL